MFDWHDSTNIIIAVVSSSGLTAFINYIAGRSKNKMEVKQIEQEIVSDYIDQAKAVVEAAMEILNSVREERDHLIADKKELQKINDELRQQILNNNRAKTNEPDI